ncbi:MAG TPA: hypothetical protein VJ124_07145 [Pyrinomonadaceae bacterium]|nr:hypothetical protein [Pyrinomonadaceae bacterium]
MGSRKSTAQIVFLVIFSMGLSGLILRAQVPLEVGRRDWASAMPDGEGKGLVLGTCPQCHSLSPIALQRKSAKSWELLVRDMISRGAQIQVPEIDPITAYLAKNFGPNAAPLVMNVQTGPHPGAATQNPMMTAERLPEGAGKAILLNSCTSCHELSKTTDVRKSETGWRGNVKDMIRLGADLNSKEESVLVAYLSKHFGLQGAIAPATPTSTESQSSYGMGGMAGTNTRQSLGHLLPDDEGKGLILATCFQCHANISYVSGQRKAPQAWRRTVNDMISRGAQLTTQEAEIVVNYLIKHMTAEKKAE